MVFSVGQLAVDQVAQCVVGVFDAVVFFEAVATGRIAALPFGCFVGKDVVGGVEGEGFAAAGLAVAGFLNASDFVVDFRGRLKSKKRVRTLRHTLPMNLKNYAR